MLNEGMPQYPVRVQVVRDVPPPAGWPQDPLGISDLPSIVQGGRRGGKVFMMYV
jgi:hypothetical protein